jgi:hypothetical protein
LSDYRIETDPNVALIIDHAPRKDITSPNLRGIYFWTCMSARSPDIRISVFRNKNLSTMKIGPGRG